LVVAKVSSIAKKGEADIETFKGAIENELRKQKKIEIIAKDVAAKISGKSGLAEAAAAIGDSIHSVKGVMFSQPFMSIGYEPALVGSAFGLKPGTLSKPIAGNAGVFILITENVEATQPNPMMNNRANLESQYNSGLEYKLLTELKKRVNIVDNRSNFF
jgi:hypothetical protein